jgi:hypothetical protein
MSNNMNIVDKLTAKIKSSEFGELISDEDIYEMVKTSINRVFFTTETTGSGYNRRDVPPLLDRTIQELLEEKVKEQVGKWFTENSDKVLERFKIVFDQGIEKYAEILAAEKTKNTLRPILTQIVQHINEQRSGLGLPWLVADF